MTNNHRIVSSVALHGMAWHVSLSDLSRSGAIA